MTVVNVLFYIWFFIVRFINTRCISIQHISLNDTISLYVLFWYWITLGIMNNCLSTAVLPIADTVDGLSSHHLLIHPEAILINVIPMYLSNVVENTACRYGF